MCNLLCRPLAPLLAVTGIGLFASCATAQTSVVGLRFVPEITLSATTGTTGQVESATEVAGSNWVRLGTVVFTNSLMRFVDQRDPAPSAAFYRLVPLTNNGTPPPFSAPLSNFLWVSAGKFIMGSPDTDPDAADAEQPQYEVTLTYGFFMEQHEVTQAEYASVIGSNPSVNTDDVQQPVDTISWQDATNYCAQLNAREQAAGRLPQGWAYRLPTEAEWEYVARAGSTNRFAYGDDNDYARLADYAWFSANSLNTTYPVESRQPNGWGFYDMYGNVCEWCLDWWTDSHPNDSVSNPTGPASGTDKVFRGGSYNDAGSDCRSAARRGMIPNFAMSFFGIRVVLAPVTP